ncbi:MAG: hypothetical protein ACRCX2_11765 [Paraclostridium sp.]
MELLNGLGSFIINLAIIILVYKFACKHESYEIEFGWFMKPKKIKGNLKSRCNNSGDENIHDAS